jgi:hypothetical protein
MPKVARTDKTKDRKRRTEKNEKKKNAIRKRKVREILSPESFLLIDIM